MAPLGTLEQLRTYNSRATGSAAGVRITAARQSAMLRQAVRGEQAPATRPQPAPQPAPRRITIRELNEQLSKLPLGPRGRTHFALRRKDGNVDFFELRKIGVGRFLLVQLFGAPGRFASRTLTVQLQHFAALHIAENLAGAAKLFADEVGECAHCGSPLTRLESRQLGLGPTCRKKYGL
jgi:hypothetical protein